MSTLKITSIYLDLILQGRKKSTIRLGSRFIPEDERFAFEDELGRYLSVRVTGVTTKRQVELDQKDAEVDGFENVDELLSTLRELYPNSSPSDFFTIIEFEHETEGRQD